MCVRGRCDSYLIKSFSFLPINKNQRDDIPTPFRTVWFSVLTIYLRRQFTLNCFKTLTKLMNVVNVYMMNMMIPEFWRCSVSAFESIRYACTYVPNYFYRKKLINMYSDSVFLVRVCTRSLELMGTCCVNIPCISCNRTLESSF